LPIAHHARVAVVLAGLLHFPAFGQSTDAERMLDSLRELPVGLGASPQLTTPADNPPSILKIELGRRLFFDPQLSGNQTMSCSTCHDPSKGFSDGQSRPTGSHGTKLLRHTPSLLNVAYNPYQFWDGRALSLEEQVIEPLTSNREMSMTDEGELVSRLTKDTYYREMFKSVFGGEPSLGDVAKGLAAFERTIVSRGSRFDRYAAGDKSALTASEKDGLILFIGKAHCARCHDGPNFTDNKFHNIGIGNGDDGRYRITRLEEDWGAFKTPGLRNVAAHPPYMHDGSISTLGAVID
jgi:cytochrome c peroxidase